MSEFDEIFKQYQALSIQSSKEEFEALKLKFVYFSNKLEGSNLTLAQTIDVIKHHTAKGETSIVDSIMAIDHYRALNDALLFGANKYPLSETMLLRLHETLLKNSFQIDPFYQSWAESGQQLGSYKVKSNRIKIMQNGVESYHETPSPEQSRELIVQSIDQYIKSDELFLVRLAKLIQNCFNAHAFFDGNKRMTRLIVAHELLANGYPLMLPHGDSYMDYNAALVEGMLEHTSNAIQRVLETGFNQQLTEEIEKSKAARSSSGKGFGLIL